MKTLVLAAALLTSSVAYARPQAAISLGPVLSLPEIFGGQVSFWPDDDVTIDARATLSSVEAGVTGHIPFHRGAKQGSLWSNDSASARHDFLITGMGGYVHRQVAAGSWSDSTNARGGRIIGAVGYGYTSSVDLRLEGGVSAYDTNVGWQLDPTFWISLGVFL